MDLSEELQERVDIIRHKLKFIEQKPTVACIEQLEPIMLWGNEIPQLVSIAGGTSLLTEAGQPSLTLQWETIEELNPDIIIIMPRDFAIADTIKEINILLQLPGFTELKAVKNNRLYIADGNQYFNDTDTSLVDSVEILAEIINPKQFIFGYEGQGWIKFTI